MPKAPVGWVGQVPEQAPLALGRTLRFIEAPVAGSVVTWTRSLIENLVEA